MTEHEPASRSVALEAVIRVAISKVDASRWRRSITSRDVIREAEGDTSQRTVRRAMKDAEAMGWIRKKNHSNEFVPGTRAENIDQF